MRRAGVVESDGIGENEISQQGWWTEVVVGSLSGRSREVRAAMDEDV